jgi:hypothetical protein
MVDSNSPLYHYAEKAGFMIGRVIRYTMLTGVVIFIGGKFAGFKTSYPVRNLPPTAPPSD